MTLTLIATALLYIALLFALALWGERGGKGSRSASLGHKISKQPWVYGLALAIYCTSWTYYGAIGNAAQNGWSFVPILLGPVLLYVFGLPVIAKLVAVAKQQNTTSIADFIASRYGKSHTLALVVTAIAASAIIPYIALQLKAVGDSFSVITGLPPETTGGTLKELVVALLMAAFAIAFGARKMEITEYRSGMMLAIAFESLVKLVALLAVAFLGVWLLSSGPQGFTGRIASLELGQGWTLAGSLNSNFLIQTAMAAGAILCLPRQFHVTVVDNLQLSHLKTARWLFPLYLILTMAAIAVIALAGQAFVPAANESSPMLSLLLPMQYGLDWLTLLVYVGGISAATAMVIIGTLTLSTMISNDVVMPLWLSKGKAGVAQARRYSQQLLSIRRLSMVVILALGWVFYHLVFAAMNLVSIGLLAFSLVLQLLPAIIGGLYWKKGHAQGVYMGLGLGLTAWVLAIWVPLNAISLVDAESIITRGTLISLTLNTLGYVVFSLLAVPSLVDKVQSTAFVQPRKLRAGRVPSPALEASYEGARVQDLVTLMETFLGRERSTELINQYRRQYKFDQSGNASAHFTDFSERAIAGVLGAATARSLVRAAIEDRQLNLEEVVHFFDDTTQALQTQQSIMFSSLENLAQGISVVDADLRLVVWNKRYLELFDYPGGMVQPGRPIADLIRYNAERGECGAGEIDDLVNKRLRYMQEGSAHRFIRRRSDGRVIEMVGNPLPSGGFVTSFTDVTEHIETQQALEDANINLEARIKTRTDEVQEINRELRKEIERRRDVEQALKQAKAEAEEANASKTRFLALASHDILQPLNAARLYLSAIDKERLDPESQGFVGKVDNALDSTEHLLSTLLAIAKMDQGAMQPKLKHITLNQVLEPLVQEYSVLAEQRHLEFRARLNDLIVETDPTYLRRILQNFLSNAVKYTDQGGVLLGVRKKKDYAEIRVWDTGPGIPEQQQRNVFEAFVRLHKGSASGVGLGLSVAKRMSEQLGYPIGLRSEPGKGTCFTVCVPYGDPAKVSHKPKHMVSGTAHGELTLLCVDDDDRNLDALEALLTKWNCNVVRFTSAHEALAWAQQHPAPDGVLLDYQLDEDEQINGLKLSAQLNEIWGKVVPGALVTAVREAAVKSQARKAKLQFLPKPVKPAQLKALLQHLQRVSSR